MSMASPTPVSSPRVARATRSPPRRLAAPRANLGAVHANLSHVVDQGLGPAAVAAALLRDRSASRMYPVARSMQVQRVARELQPEEGATHVGAELEAHLRRASSCEARMPARAASRTRPRRHHDHGEMGMPVSMLTRAMKPVSVAKGFCAKASGEKVELPRAVGAMDEQPVTLMGKKGAAQASSSCASEASDLVPRARSPG
jgi:hypothetical protein